MNNPSIPSNIAYVFAAAFLFATVVAYVPNPLVGDGAFFHTNLAHNLVHLATAAAFLGVAILGSRAATIFMLVFGVVYLLTGLAGFTVTGASGEGLLLGLVHINAADNFLHLGLGAAILGAGLLSRGVLSGLGQAPVSVRMN